MAAPMDDYLDDITYDDDDPRPTYSRQTTLQTQGSKRDKIKGLGRSMRNSVADFFGVGEDLPEIHEKWRQRSRNLAKKSVGGGVKAGHPELARAGTVDSVFVDTGSHFAGGTPAPFPPMGLHGVPLSASYHARRTPTPVDPLHRPYRQMSQPGRAFPMRQLSRQISTASNSRRSQRAQQFRQTRKDSVVKMAFDGVKTLVTPTRKSTRRKPYLRSRSFAPASISSNQDDMDALKSPLQDSVFSEEPILDDVFFDYPTSASPVVRPYSTSPIIHPASSHDFNAGDMDPSTCGERTLSTLWESGQQTKDGTSDEEDHRGENGETQPLQRPVKGGWNIGRQRTLPTMPSLVLNREPQTPEMLDDEDEVDGFPFTPGERLPHSMAIRLTDNLGENRREIGKGMVGRLFKRSYRRERIDSDIKAQLDEIVDHRPYFTYWVTFVQVLIYVISISVYGIAPIGFEEHIIKAEVMMPSLALEEKSYYEKDNFWIGPRQADLIHLGAKYSPCMRKDENIVAAILSDHREENQTACCIRNDGSGCVQSSRKKCSKTLSTWNKWEGSDERMSGSVCGLDPLNCVSPRSHGAFTWRDDLTTWPICINSTEVISGNHPHLMCEVVGRPCCVGIQGECIITTREYCTFRRGYFHEEASLCSQISCMNEICGMISFLDPVRPDQVYRLWTSLFLHAGLLQLVVTVLFQFFVMRDLEKLAGWLRIGIIYLGTGIAGSLSSAIFLPYHVEAGPAGSQFGLLACLIVEVVQNWYILQHPSWAAGKLFAIVLVLFAVGLLPMVDNYAHLVGFLFGLLLSFSLLPYVTFGKYDRKRKIIGIVICLFTAIGTLALLFVLFYVIGVYTCPNCHYFNCIPFTPKFCESMEVKIGRTEIY